MWVLTVKNITDALGYSKLCSRWFPWILIKYHKNVRKEVYSDVLSRYESEAESFPSRIATEDDMWTHQYEPHEMRFIGMALSNFFLEEEI